jgi:hypothetical protein
MKSFHQGTYKIKNWDKYVGTKHPRFLSSYELEVFSYLDRSPSVIKWGAEQVVVEYYNPVKQRKARYIVDVYVKYKDRNGEIREQLIEIKPYQQCSPPSQGKKKRKDVYAKELATYNTNQAKWKAAEKYAKDRQWEFKVLTERSIFR